jgi:type II restriction enzyme
MSLAQAKHQLDTIIRKSRVHLYKPIQIAEILYQHRTGFPLAFPDLESYRNPSKKWRDDVTRRLVGRISTSSARFQDNLFEANAMPPEFLAELGAFNEQPEHSGIVEAYIYRSLGHRLGAVSEVRRFVETATAETFRLRAMVDLFEHSAGLRRSIDKMYEIAVYALFATLVRALRVEVQVEIKNTDREIFNDFRPFIAMLTGIREPGACVSLTAALYRVGVTNAADRGLDMWSNFGTAVQVKHLTLDAELAECIAEGIMAEGVVIVCRDAEKAAIDAILEQVGWGQRIRGIVTLSDLEGWYALCLGPKHRAVLGGQLLADIVREFIVEFPSLSVLEPFMQERGYAAITLEGWEHAG